MVPGRVGIKRAEVTLPVANYGQHHVAADAADGRRFPKVVVGEGGGGGGGAETAIPDKSVVN